jgi:hypothetical protein
LGVKREQVTGEWRKLCYVELHESYASLNNIRVIKLREMTWAGHVTREGGEEKWEEVFNLKT